VSRGCTRKGEHQQQDHTYQDPVFDYILFHCRTLRLFNIGLPQQQNIAAVSISLSAENNENRKELENGEMMIPSFLFSHIFFKLSNTNIRQQHATVKVITSAG
jgi:hypothetical protein